MLFPGAMQELGGSQEKLLFWLHAKQGKVSFFLYSELLLPHAQIF